MLCGRFFFIWRSFEVKEKHDNGKESFCFLGSPSKPQWHWWTANQWGTLRVWGTVNYWEGGPKWGALYIVWQNAIIINYWATFDKTGDIENIRDNVIYLISMSHCVINTMKQRLAMCRHLSPVMSLMRNCI